MKPGQAVSSLAGQYSTFTVIALLIQRVTKKCLLTARYRAQQAHETEDGIKHLVYGLAAIHIWSLQGLLKWKERKIVKTQFVSPLIKTHQTAVPVKQADSLGVVTVLLWSFSVFFFFF